MPQAKSHGLRLLLLLFLVLLTYDGALRKWVLPGSEAILFLLKDALLVMLLAYVGSLALYKRGRLEVPPTVQNLFWGYALWVIICALNPHLPNLLVGIWGAKAHLLYASLILLLPLIFVNLQEALQTFAKIYPWLVIPVCALALAQVALPSEHFLNEQVRGGIEGISYFGEEGLVRVAGPFSYVSGMAGFVQLAALVGVGLYIAGFRSWLFLAGLACTIVALPVTGSRAVIAITSVGVIVMLVTGVAARVVSGQLFVRAVVALGILIAVSFTMQDTAWEALHQRYDDNREEGAGRVITAFTNAFIYFEWAGLFGFGSGATNLAAVALTSEVPFSWLPVPFEEESGRIVLELGIVGWTLSLLLRLATAFWAISLTFKGATHGSRVVALMCLPMMFSAVHQGNGVFAASYAAVAYWFCLSLLAMAQYESRWALSVNRSAVFNRRFARSAR